MLLAYNQEKELIFADKNTKRKETYFCPSCNEPVYLKKGEIMIPHFAHYQTCTQFVFSEGETKEHLSGKKELARWFYLLGAEVELEAYLPQIKQRPDLLVRFPKKASLFAIEFQCSLISPEQVTTRSAGYLKAGYIPIWIFGENFAKQKLFSPTMKAGMFEIKGEASCLIFQKGQLYLYQGIKSSGYPEKYLAKLFLFSRKNNQITYKKQLNYSINGLQSNASLIKNYLIRQCRYKNSSFRNFFQVLYQNNDYYLNLPSVIYQPLSLEWLLQENPFLWRYQIKNFIEEKFNNSVIYIDEMINLLPSNLLQTHKSIQLSNPLPQLLSEYLKSLSKAGFLRRTGKEKWTHVGSHKPHVK